MNMIQDYFNYDPPKRTQIYILANFLHFSAWAFWSTDAHLLLSSFATSVGGFGQDAMQLGFEQMLRMKKSSSLPVVAVLAVVLATVAC